MKNQKPFRYFKTSPEIICLAVMMYVRFLLSLHNVEDLLHERGNRTFKEEFYYRYDLLADSIGAMRFELKKALNKYNTYRPHKSLGGLRFGFIARLPGSTHLLMAMVVTRD